MSKTDVRLVATVAEHYLHLLIPISVDLGGARSSLAVCDNHAVFFVSRQASTFRHPDVTLDQV